jgi:murein DD-endopeptidase MepM/ murein hydrolase activator NlpD
VHELYTHPFNVDAGGGGATIIPGEVLGHTGESGDVTGPHLHLEARNLAGVLVDPIAVFPHEHAETTLSNGKTCPPRWRVHRDGAGEWCVPNMVDDIVPGIGADVERVGEEIKRAALDPLGSPVRDAAVSTLTFGAVIAVIVAVALMGLNRLTAE